MNLQSVVDGMILMAVMNLYNQNGVRLKDGDDDGGCEGNGRCRRRRTGQGFWFRRVKWYGLEQREVSLGCDLKSPECQRLQRIQSKKSVLNEE